MITRKPFLIPLFIAIIFPTYSSAKVEFPISDQKMAVVRKNNKALKSFLDPDYIDLDGVDYNLNLMWINKALKEEQKGIHPENDTFIETIANWAKGNQRSVVNVWFDSALTSEQSVQYTQSLLDKRVDPSRTRVVLKDIRSLQAVQDNSAIFSDPRMPVYFRADLARALVLDAMIQDNPSQYSIYSDLDIAPLAKYRLFDKNTLENLKKYGFVMAKCKYHYIENGFQIMSNHQANLIKAHKKAVLDVNIARAHNAINGTACLSDRDRNDGISPFNRIAQAVYGSYTPMFEYFYTLEDQGRCVLKYDNTDYDPDRDGLEAFGIQKKFVQQYTFQAATHECMEKDRYERVKIPRKDVNYPPLSGQYYL